jgi:hypothetical protein
VVELFSVVGVVFSCGSRFQRWESFSAFKRHFTAWSRFLRSLLISALGVVSSVGLSFSVQIAVFSAEVRFRCRFHCSVLISGLGVVFSGEYRFQL